MNSKEAAKQFVNTIITTKEYKDFKEAKAIIDNKVELRKHVESFQKKQVDIYQNSRSERELQSKLQTLSRSFAPYSNIPEIQRYLQASERFNQMMGELNKAVDDTLQLELNK